METRVEAVWKCERLTRWPRPLLAGTAADGSSSRQEDYAERELDLNSDLVRNPEATYFVRVSGCAMAGAGVRDGDILIVDRSLEPARGSIVVAVVEGEMIVRRVSARECFFFLEESEEGGPPLRLRERAEVWGVVTSSIHRL